MGGVIDPNDFRAPVLLPLTPGSIVPLPPDTYGNEYLRRIQAGGNGGLVPPAGMPKVTVDPPAPRMVQVRIGPYVHRLSPEAARTLARELNQAADELDPRPILGPYHAEAETRRINGGD